MARVRAPAPLSPEDLEACLRVLEAFCADRADLAALDVDTRRRLLVAAGRLSRPHRAELRDFSKAFRRRAREERRASDDRILGATGMRTQRLAPVFRTPPPRLLEAMSSVPGERAPGPELGKARKCYVCKAEYRRVHAFYHSMCAPCAELNWAKRNQTARLEGRVAVVTGARVKIGYQTAIFLLRSGACVIATTRFPRDAAARYALEPDFDEWSGRLHVHGLDLRHTPSVELFADHLDRSFDRLDFLINNACQTVRRPPGFYAHLADAEAEPAASLPSSAHPLLASHDRLVARASAGPKARFLGVREPARLSQLAGADDGRAFGPDIFPAGQLDQDLQQIDLRDKNSWRLTLSEVPTVELLEVHLVNAVAPFVLASKLKPLMTRAAGRDKHVVNVSAMEGQFYRSFKTDKHPHTNMAKAALNMLTRTSASDYVKDGIHMNSVDTGWITDEDPAAIAARKTEEHGFHPPLDVVDGAARVCDPIFSGFASGQHAWGQFFKDYEPTDW